jgi:uncharacterized protein (TIGR00730 family)
MELEYNILREKDMDSKELIKNIMDSPTYKIAETDDEFMESYETRAVRLELDYLKAELIMKKHDINHTIVVFGSARFDESNPYYKDAREFGRIVGAKGRYLDDSPVTMMTGGGPGIMEAANRGAYDVGAKSIGLNINLPREQFPNPYITPELCFLFHYFAIRKLHFTQRARALVVYPGGFGTLDELFEILTLIETKKAKKIPVVLVSSQYWNKAINFEFLIQEGTIAKDDIDIFKIVENAKEAWEYIFQWYK